MFFSLTFRASTGFSSWDVLSYVVLILFRIDLVIVFDAAKIIKNMIGRLFFAGFLVQIGDVVALLGDEGGVLCF